MTTHLLKITAVLLLMLFIASCASPIKPGVPIQGSRLGDTRPESDILSTYSSAVEAQQIMIGKQSEESASAARKKSGGGLLGNLFGNTNYAFRASRGPRETFTHSWDVITQLDKDIKPGKAHKILSGIMNVNVLDTYVIYKPDHVLRGDSKRHSDIKLSHIINEITALYRHDEEIIKNVKNLNVFYLPVKVKKKEVVDESGNKTQQWLNPVEITSLDNFNVVLSKAIASKIVASLTAGEKQLDNTFFNSAGPFFITTHVSPATMKEGELKQLLLVDFSNVHIDAIPEVFHAYKKWLQENYKKNEVLSLESLRLDLLSVMLDLSDNISLIKVAFADWLK